MGCLCIEPRPEKAVPEFVAAMCTEGDEVQGSIVDFRQPLVANLVEIGIPS
jgi:hypothetical protein